MSNLTINADRLDGEIPPKIVKLAVPALSETNIRRHPIETNFNHLANESARNRP
jgi:hypothetical protein